MRVLIWIAVAVLFAACLASFCAALFVSFDRRFVLLAFAFQVAMIAMASFLDRGVS